MKRTTLTNLVLTFALLATLGACGKKDTNPSNSSSNWNNIGGNWNNVGGTVTGSLEAFNAAKKALKDKKVKDGITPPATIRYVTNTVSQATSNTDWWNDVLDFLNVQTSQQTCKSLYVFSVFDDRADVRESSSYNCYNGTPSYGSIYSWTKSNSELAPVLADDAIVQQVCGALIQVKGYAHNAIVVDLLDGSTPTRYVIAPTMPLLANPVAKTNLSNGSTKILEGTSIQIGQCSQI